MVRISAEDAGGAHRAFATFTVVRYRVAGIQQRIQNGTGGRDTYRLVAFREGGGPGVFRRNAYRARRGRVSQALPAGAGHAGGASRRADHRAG